MGKGTSSHISMTNLLDLMEIQHCYSMSDFLTSVAAAVLHSTMRRERWCHALS